MITTDPDSSVPPFEQVRARLAERTRSGTRLPAVRRLAEDLDLAADTVARAHRELEAEGLVETRGRNGTVVSWSADEAERRLQQAAAAFAERVRALGVTSEAARSALERALGDA